MGIDCQHTKKDHKYVADVPERFLYDLEGELDTELLYDMLISLDMSNRMPIVKMILNQDNDPDLRFF